MFKQISKLLKSSTVVAVLLVSGCGGGTPASDGSIATNPAKIAWTSAAAAPDTTTTPPTPAVCDPTTDLITFSEIVITVLDGGNKPVPNASVHVTLDLSNSTSNALLPVMSLYDDPSWTGGTSTIPATAPVSASYNTVTGSDGTKHLIVGMDQGCEYKGYLSVSYGAIFGQAELSVTGSQ